MRFNLFCKIFGHKFFFTSFEKTGEKFLDYVGTWVDSGNTYRHETSYCTRCGLERTTINAQQSHAVKVENSTSAFGPKE